MDEEIQKMWFTIGEALLWNDKPALATSGWNDSPGAKPITPKPGITPREKRKDPRKKENTKGTK